jgi:hypothetical protein
MIKIESKKSTISNKENRGLMSELIMYTEANTQIKSENK